VHLFTDEEARRYPGDWSEGVSFAEAETWEHPVALATVWPETSAAAENPGGRFFGGVYRMKSEDYETILAKRTPGAVGVGPPTHRDGDRTSPQRETMSDRLYSVTERLREFLAGNSQAISEDATRALFINKYLDALG
jgi:hypothetical protein